MNLNKKLFLALALFSLLVNGQMNVEQDSISAEKLEEVLVTATRTERQLSSLPLPAQIISKEQIKATNSLRLSDVINEQTGLITVSDFGGGEGLQLQGMDSQYTLVMIDGVPLIGRSAGTLDLERITVANIKQIEVVKGASSCLYGNEALGGVLNIITETPEDDFSGNANYRFGSFNTHDTSVNLNYKDKEISISGFVNRYASDGYDLTDFSEINTVEPFENYTLNGKIGYRFDEKTELLLSSRLFIQDQESAAISNGVYLQGEGNLTEWNTHLKLEHKFSKKWRVYGEFYATQYETKEELNNPDGSLFSGAYFDQLMIRPEMRAFYTLNKNNSFVVGAGLTHETLDRTYFSEEPEFNSPYVYLQYDANPTENLNVILGARYDSHNEYKSQFSPKIAARYKLTDKISVKASTGYGYKAPDFRQLYFNFTNPTVGYTVLGYNLVSTVLPEMQAQGLISNIVVPLSEYGEELKPESSISYNIGVDYKVNNDLSFSANLFRNDIKNLIDTRVVANKSQPVGQNVFSYYNANKVYTQGVEFNANWNPLKQLKISGGYQLLYAKDKEVEEAFENGEVFAVLSGQPAQLKKSHYFGLPNRSRHMANIKFFYKNFKWKFNANLRGTYRSKYGLVDTNSSQGYIDTYDEFVDPYSIWDVALNKTLFKNAELGVGIDNMFDFQDPPTSETDFISISNISGRIIYGKLNINF